MLLLPKAEEKMDAKRDRRSFVVNFAAVGALSMTSCAHRDSASRVRRIGLLVGAGYPQLVAAFKSELSRLGYVEGENIVIEVRLSAGDSAPQAAELVRLNLELIVAAALPAALAVRDANPTARMVIATCPGMVSNGFAQSLERPGGAVTGMDELPPGLTRRRMTLLKRAAPELRRIALLSTTPGTGGHETQLAEAEQTAEALGVAVRAYRVTSVSDFQNAFASMLSDSMDGLLNFQGGLSLGNRQRIVDFAAQNRLPAMYQATLFAEAGGLMAWAPNLEEQFRAAARYVDEILRGASPGDLPITHPSRYYLTINSSAARALPLTLPQALLAEADRVL